MNFRHTTIWTLGALVAVVSVALAPNAFATGQDNGPTYTDDQDGDGMPDDSDPCPNNPDTTCSSQKCGTTTITGDGSTFAGDSCQYEYNGANPVRCPDGTYAPTSADCPTGGTGSDAGSGGGSDGGGGGSGAGGGREATPEPAAPPPLGTAQATVEGCAAAKPNYRSYMDMAKDAAHRKKLSIVVRSGPLPERVAGLLACYGEDNGQGRLEPSSITMTIDEAAISDAVARRRGTRKQTEYMHLFAEVLLHEYKHAYDCATGRFPSDPKDPRHFDLEIGAQRMASADYRELFGTTSPEHRDYNHAEHGNPDCI